MALRNSSNIYYYNRNIKETIIGFLNLFTDLKVGRYSSETGALDSTSPIQVLFGPIERSSYVNSRGETVQRTVQLPLLHFELTGMELDKTRAFPMKTLHIMGERSGVMKDTLMPLPYNFNITINVYAKYQEEISILLEQILGIFNYHVVYYRKHPIFPEEITLSHWASVTTPPSFAYNYEYSAELRRDILAVPIGFTIESWMGRESYESYGIVTEIINNFKEYTTAASLSQIRLLADATIRDYFYTADPYPTTIYTPKVGDMISGTTYSAIVQDVPESGHLIVKFNSELEVFLEKEVTRIGDFIVGTTLTCDPYEPFKDADYGWSGYSGYSGYSEIKTDGYSEI